MKEQPHYTNILTEDFFNKYYSEKRMSFPKLRDKLKSEGYNIAISTIYSYCKKLGILMRGSSEARREWDNSLDYNVSYLNKNMIEAIDGFLLGDGGASIYNGKIKVGRLSCGLEHEEFCRYLMSFFSDYKPKISKYKDRRMKQGFIWNGKTKFHPDIYKQYKRWYKLINGKYIKSVPNDVVISPISVMSWFLGDGSISHPEDNSTILLRLSTDGFQKEEVEFLVTKLIDKSIKCHRSNENRIIVNSRGIPSFFNYIGNQSPIFCYNYKFDLPYWRFSSKRMKEVSDELGVDYNRLSYLVKINKLSCYRLTPNGRPRFLPEHIECAKQLIKNKELYLIKNK